MLVERTNKEIIIRLPASVNVDDLQAFINYARYKEITSKLNVKQSDVDKLANKVNDSWWQANKDRFVK